MAQQPIPRNYIMSDPSLIQWLRKILAILELYLTDFTTYDPMFDAGFVTDFETQINDAEALPDDSVVLGQQKTLTDTTQISMDNCRTKNQHLKRFVKKAFPTQTGIWDEFGFSKYEDARKSQSKMVLFMRDLYTTAIKYKTQLIAVNFTLPMIEEIKTLHDEISGADSSQELKKETRTVDTQNRVQAYNALYEVGVDICEAGKYIYRSDPAKYNFFIIYPGGAQNVFTGGISAGETINIKEKTFAPDATIILENLGTGTLDFGLMKLVDDVVNAGVGVTVAAGTSQTVTASQLGDVVNNHFLNVTNNGGVDGNWSVTI